MGDIFIVHANQHLPRQMTTSVNSNQSHTFLHREQIINQLLCLLLARFL